MNNNIQHIAVDTIKPDPNQPRKERDYNSIVELANSMQQVGLINPIEITKDRVIVTGETRWRAAQHLGWANIPCRIIKIKKEKRLQRQIIENIQRKDMNKFDTAMAVKELYKTKSSEEISEILGKSASWVHYQIQSLELGKTELKKFLSTKAGIQECATIRRLPKTCRDKLYEKIQREKLGAHQIRNVAARLATASISKRKEILNHDFSNKPAFQVFNELKEISPTKEEEFKLEVEYFKSVKDAANKLFFLLSRFDFKEATEGNHIFDFDKATSVDAVEKVIKAGLTWINDSMAIRTLDKPVIDIEAE